MHLIVHFCSSLYPDCVVVTLGQMFLKKTGKTNMMDNAVKITIIRDHAIVETTGERIMISDDIYRPRTSVAINLLFKLNLQCM